MHDVLVVEILVVGGERATRVVTSRAHIEVETRRCRGLQVLLMPGALEPSYLAGGHKGPLTLVESLSRLPHAVLVVLFHQLLGSLLP